MDWLVKSVPEHRHASGSSHEMPLQRRAKVPRKHNIFTHLPKHRFEVPREENFGDLNDSGSENPQ